MERSTKEGYKEKFKEVQVGEKKHLYKKIYRRGEKVGYCTINISKQGIVAYGGGRVIKDIYIEGYFGISLFE